MSGERHCVREALCPRGAASEPSSLRGLPGNRQLVDAAGGCLVLEGAGHLINMAVQG